MAVSWKAAAMAAAVVCMLLAGLALSSSTTGDVALPGAGARGVAVDTDNRVVDYRWYDFFDMPYGEWWDWRYFYFGNELVLTDSFPYMNRHYYNATHIETFSSARLNITGRSMPELSMNEGPQFLPLFGEARGGTAVIDWYMQYLTEDEMEWYPMYTADWLDGWVIALNGTVTLDKTAAMAVMGITSEGYDDFETWWTANDDLFLGDYIDWILYEGNTRLDIFPMYDYPFVPLRLNIDAEKVGDDIVLTYDTVAWGMEALMTRWLHDAFMPTEWWFEDFTMHAEIGPESASIDIDTAVPYAIKAWETNEGGTPCWVWQGMLQDRIASGIIHPSSNYDLYCDREHLCKSPGCAWYDCMVVYRYVPGCHNLSEGESLSLEWPEEEILFMDHDGLFSTVNTTSKGIVEYSEPSGSDMGDSVDWSPDSRTITFQGPVDFWSWSESQDEHDYLYDEWQRLDVLPWGMPYVELTAWLEDTPPIAYLKAERAPDATSASQYVLNASKSVDSEDGLEALEFRWDLDGDGTMDTEWSSEPVIEHDLGGAGTFEVSVSVLDSDNMTATASVVVTVVEVDPPTTTMSAEGTEGFDGWFVAAVDVTLSSEDASGVAGTYYRMGEGPWFNYTGAFDIGSSGVFSLSYYSIDTEGNVEPQRNSTVKVDIDSPSAIIGDFVFTEGSPGEVVVSWLHGDGTSGVNRSEISLDGGERMSVGMDMSYSYSGLAEGNHTFELVVYDNAGLSTTVTRTFTMPSEGDGGILLYVGAGVAVAVIVAVAALLLLRRKRPKA